MKFREIFHVWMTTIKTVDTKLTNPLIATNMYTKKKNIHLPDPFVCLNHLTLAGMNPKSRVNNSKPIKAPIFTWRRYSIFSVFSTSEVCHPAGKTCEACQHTNDITSGQRKPHWGEESYRCWCCFFQNEPTASAKGQKESVASFCFAFWT